MPRTPQQARSRQKVEKILTAAERVLIDRGYEHFTTNHVAAEAGCNIGTLYRYFPDKEALIRALYRQWLEDERDVNTAYVSNLAAPVDPVTFVTGLFRHHLNLHDENAHRLAVELTKALYLSDDIRADDRSYEDELVAFVGHHVSTFTGQSFSESQISFVFKLAVALLVMINKSPPNERPAMSEMALQSLAQTVRGFLA